VVIGFAAMNNGFNFRPEHVRAGSSPAKYLGHWLRCDFEMIAAGESRFSFAGTVRRIVSVAGMRVGDRSKRCWDMMASANRKSTHPNTPDAGSLVLA
jgi:hypothetical protein